MRPQAHFQVQNENQIQPNLSCPNHEPHSSPLHFVLWPATVQPLRSQALTATNHLFSVPCPKPCLTNPRYNDQYSQKMSSTSLASHKCVSIRDQQPGHRTINANTTRRNMVKHLKKCHTKARIIKDGYWAQDSTRCSQCYPKHTKELRDFNMNCWKLSEARRPNVLFFSRKGWGATGSTTLRCGKLLK